MSQTSEEFENFVDTVDAPFSLNIEDIQDDNELLLHRAVFEHQPVSYLIELLSLKPKLDIGQKDRHGNTPLHLAVMLGHKDHINFLLEQNAPIKSKNSQGWTPLDEAISYGNRKIIKNILRVGRKQAKQSLSNRSPKLIETLSLIKDFQMELHWEFYSWIPLAKRFLPSDICRIAKKGSSIRLDTTLLDFNDRRWQRGNITFLFVGSKKSDSLVIMDNELKVYQYLRYNDSVDIEEDIDLLMSSDLIHPQMSTKSITFTRAQAGWFFARYNKTEKVGQFEADFYNINGLTIETKKRREHLSDEDIQSNKSLYDTLKKSLDVTNQRKNSKLINKSDDSFDYYYDIDQNNEITKNGQEVNGDVFHDVEDEEMVHHDYSDYNDNNDDDSLATDDNNDILMEAVTNGLIKRRKSLPPPVKSKVSWLEYINAPKGLPPCLGRPWKMKESSKTFKATIAMSQEFPLSIESLLNILEVITQFKHFKKLKEFVNLNLPPGFPVKIDIPLIPTILARVTFLNFSFNDNFGDQLFEIPADYTENPNRFPDL